MNHSTAALTRWISVLVFALSLFLSTSGVAHAATLGGIKLDVMGILNLLSPVIGLLLLKQVRTPKDHQRAALLAQLADDIAAVLIAERKGSGFADLLRFIVAQLREHGVTANDDVLNRVAKAALARAGVSNR